RAPDPRRHQRGDAADRQPRDFGELARRAQSAKRIAPPFLWLAQCAPLCGAYCALRRLTQAAGRRRLGSALSAVGVAGEAAAEAGARQRFISVDTMLIGGATTSPVNSFAPPLRLTRFTVRSWNASSSGRWPTLMIAVSGSRSASAFISIAWLSGSSAEVASSITTMSGSCRNRRAK